MKRTLALVLVVAMLACMIPAFSIASVADEEPENGLNAKIYQLVAKSDVLPYSHDRYYDIVGTSSGEGGRCSFDDTVRFHNALPWLIKTSKEDTGRAGTGLTGLDGYDYDQDGYLVKWEGTITAATTGDYTLVGRKIDNGFLAYVDQDGDGEFTVDERFYDYASPNHWFDGDNDRLVSQQGAFHLEAGEATAVQFWYYEAGGGEACIINVSTEGGANDKSFGDAGLTLSLDKKVYTSNLAVNHDRIREILPAGVKADGSVAVDDNGCQANMAGNHYYDDTIDALMAQMFLLEEKVLPNYETAAFGGLGYNGFEYEDSLIDYTGYVTATVGGTYQFGTAKVDNCLMVEIQIDGEWVTVYEFWAKNVWNDNSTTYSDTIVELEEGKSYPIHVTFLEINGGEAIESRIKVNGEEMTMAGSKLVFTVEEPVGEVKPTTEEFLAGDIEWRFKTSGPKNEFQIRDEAWYTDLDYSADWATTTNVPGLWDAYAQGEFNTDDRGRKHQSLWLVTTFEVEDASYWEGYELMTRMAFDDNYRLYVNGTLTQVNTGWSNGVETLSLGNNAADLLVDGTNIIAVKLVQGWGGASFKMEALYATTDANSNDPYNYHYSIGTAQELLDYVAVVNADPGATPGHRVQITADIDMAGYDWTPMTKYIGRIYGNGHTISNITYSFDGSADQREFVGLFVHDLANGGGNGRITDLNFENCTLTVNANGKNRTAGIVAGLVDRGIVENATVKGCEINGDAYWAGAIAGRACWGADDKGVHVENCGAIDTVVNATNCAAGIVVVTNDAEATIGNIYLEDVTLNAPETIVTPKNSGNAVVVHSITLAGNNKFGTALANPEGDYTFYYQTRVNADDASKVDYRIICVANTEWATTKSAVKVQMSFTDGTTTKSTTQAATTVYSSVTATGEGYTDVYTVADGYVIFGWVVEGVPADFAATAPTAVVVD